MNLNLSLKNLIFTLVALTALSLGVGYSLADRWMVALGAAGIGLVWLLAQRWDLSWTTSFGLLSCIGLAAVGVQQDVSTFWMLLGTVGALAAWDLARFGQRLDQTKKIHQGTVMRSLHFKRLQLVVGSGLLVALAASGVRVQLNFGWAVLISLMMVVCLSIVVRVIRRASERAPDQSTVE